MAVLTPPRGGLEVAVDVREFGAVGDGVTDDTAAFHAAKAAAGVNGRVVVPEGLYVTDGLTLDVAGQVWDFTGAVMRKKATSTSPHLLASASVLILRGEFDGNRAAGAASSGISARSTARVECVGTYVHHQRTAGFSTVRVGTSQPGPTLVCRGTRADDQDDGNTTGGAAAGYSIDAFTSFICDAACSAARNARDGWFVEQGAYLAQLDGGYATLNGRSGFEIRCDHVKAGTLIAVDNGKYGYEGLRSGGTVNGGEIAAILTARTGVTAGNSAGTGVELFGVNGLSIGTVQCDSDLGYGVAITKSTVDASPSTDITIGTIVARHLADPVLHISGDSTKCHVGLISARDIGSYAWSMGEGFGSALDCTVDTIVAANCAYGVWRGDSASKNNRVGTIIARDCHTTDPLTPGLVHFDGVGTDNNVCDRLEARSNAGATRPLRLVSFGAGTSGNVVRRVDGNDFQTSAVLDSSGLNTAHHRVPAFDSSVLLNGSTATRESMPRLLVDLATIAPTNREALAVALPLYAGDVITSLSFVAGTTALTAGVDPHLLFALYDPELDLIAQTADQGAASAWAAGTVKTLALSAPVTITRDGVYYAACVVDAGTGGVAPTLRGRSTGQSSPSQGYGLGQRRSAGVTTAANITTTFPAVLNLGNAAAHLYAIAT